MTYGYASRTPTELVADINGQEVRLPEPSAVCGDCGAVVPQSRWIGGEHRGKCPAQTPARQAAVRQRLAAQADAEARARAPRSCEFCKGQSVPGTIHACSPAPTAVQQAEAAHDAEKLAAVLRRGGYSVTKDAQ